MKLVNYNGLSKKSKNDDVVFIKQVPINPRNRLKKLEAIDEKVHSRDRLRKKNNER